MKRLWNWVLIKLGLMEPPRMYDPKYLEEYKGVGWKWYGGYARLNDDWIVHLEELEE